MPSSTTASPTDGCAGASFWMISSARMRVRCLRRALRKRRPSAGWPEQDGARRRQVGLGVQIFGDTDSVPEDGGVDIVVGIDIDAAHELDELPVSAR